MRFSSHVTSADRAAYEQLVSVCADDEPRWGGWKAEDLKLEIDDIALICRVCDVEEYLDMADYLRVVGAGRVHQGQPVIEAALLRACRKAIWYDVSCLCEQRDIEREQERESRRPESLDGRYGVAHLFRETHR